MTDERAEALKAIQFCLSVIRNPKTKPEDNAIWSTGTSSKPRITEEVLQICEAALQPPALDAEREKALEALNRIYTYSTMRYNGDNKDFQKVKAALSMPAWRDISSAPKDGTIIDLWMNGRRYADVYWSFSRNQKGERLEDPIWDGWVQVEERKGLSGNSYPNYIDEKGKSATHWMLIIAAPSSEGGT